MGYYYSNSVEHSCFGKVMLTICGFMFMYAGCMFVLFAFCCVISFVFGETFIVEYIKNNSDMFAFALLVFFVLSLYVYFVIKDKWTKQKLTSEEDEILSYYRFGKMSQKDKKIMARAIKLAPPLIFLKLSKMDLYSAREVFKYKDSRTDSLDYKNRDLLLRYIPDMEYTDKGTTHTLREWETILTEERIKWYKDRVRYERNMFQKHVVRSDDAKQADLLNISYLNYRRYKSYYGEIKKAESRFGLNSDEVKMAIRFAIDRIGDLQEWKDFVNSKERLILHEPTEKGRYATFYTNIISNTSNVCNVFYTSGSFYVIAYFDNITFEERDTFVHNDVMIYVYKYEFVPFVVFEFKRLRFAVPLNLKDSVVDFDKWLSSDNCKVSVHLIESNSGTFIATRDMKIKNMPRIKNIIKIQRSFDKILMDSSINKCANKSLDEMVYNGFVLEEIKGDRDTIETSLF